MDQTPFLLDFTIGEKAAVAEDGTGLVLRGYASDFLPDRDLEYFSPGSFNRGLDKYLTTNPTLCFAHQRSTGIGQVKSARIDEQGLWIEAHVSKPVPGTEREDIYNRIASGELRGFSVGGLFTRDFDSVKNMPVITDVDLAEVSVVAVPANQRTLFEVSTKALADPNVTALEAALEKLDTFIKRLSTP